ncbi:nitrite reductase [Paenibacillus sp. J5C_2022]|uniref:nitrite reductase n=1 Tax=Paenibacillus sp. J5C2022 TaxID=2977129 RepID=UPI0021CFB78F|nr:nitrite reductase [Paenibacillus sp. J5C2022]MCU6711534.1 nitrite reductase [Paenibacillus sp. J5C2022]
MKESSIGETMNIALASPVQVGGNIFTPEQLAKISNVVGLDAKIEITPFRQIYVEVPIDQRGTIQQELERSGLEVYTAGAVTKSLIACQFCRGAEEAGLDTARMLNQAIAGIETPTPMKIGYAGCALGTSEPLLKNIGVVKMRDKFDIYVGGESKGLKATLAKKLVSELAEDELVAIIMKLIDYYKANAKGKEKFSRFVERISLEKLQGVLL